LMEAITRPVRDAMNYQHVTTPELRSVAVKAHSAILSAISDRNEDKASERMERHVSAYRDIATEHETNEEIRKKAAAL
jgi:GntR family transcriptional repressor for pyruvate dehydrogenase complex